MADRLEIKGVKEVERLLSGIAGGADMALVRSVNRALIAGRKVAAKEIVKDLVVTAAEAKDSFTMEKANKSKIMGVLKSTGRPLSFIGKGKLRFRGTYTISRKGVSSFNFTIKKSKGRKKFPGAFILAVRRKDKSDERRERMFIRDARGLKAMYTTRVSDALENKEAMAPVLKYMADQAQKTLEHETDRLP